MNALNSGNSLGFSRIWRLEASLLLFCHGVSETQRKDWESARKVIDLMTPNSRQRLRATARAEWYASVKEEN
jgi:hypothetical protein